MALEKKQGVSNLELMYEELLEEERAKEQRREQKRQKRKKKKAKTSQIAEKENIAVEIDNDNSKCEVSRYIIRYGHHWLILGSQIYMDYVGIDLPPIYMIDEKQIYYTCHRVVFRIWQNKKIKYQQNFNFSSFHKINIMYSRVSYMKNSRIVAI